MLWIAVVGKLLAKSFLENSIEALRLFRLVLSQNLVCDVFDARENCFFATVGATVVVQGFGRR